MAKKTMTLLEWRKKQSYSQALLCMELEKYAAEKLDPPFIERLPQTTYGYWERGTMPKRHWIRAIEGFTRGAVTAASFI